MLTIHSHLPFSLSLLLLLLLFTTADAAPKRKGKTATSASLTPQQQAAQIPQGISEATDGSTILDTTATVNGLPLRFRISGPASAFTTATNISGASASPGDQGTLGLNVLLHGDGGQSFFDFPNQAVQNNLMGVAVLAPSEQLLWGQSSGPPSGLSRPDGAAHSLAVRDLIRDVLPQVAAFDPANIFFTGVSGGSLTLSGFFVPAHMAEFAGTGVLLMCGGLEPQVDVVGAADFAGNTRIHFQSTQRELALLQPAIPAAIEAYEALASQAGLGADEIGALQTVDNTPDGGHCEFDEQGFSSGIQLIANKFGNIMQGGDGAVDGINAQSVLTPVVGNEDLSFKAGQKRDTMRI
ncbi:Cyclin-like F-box [Coniochaeta hoffmannii]|uniref:Cyclin-like F-box n=1 Tax=Coniochaeta hoffmannii TaxID=91930 RepID=A0AA38W2Q6_9PEZI|nr:Cyclin-like F-box [Coniochaeta hoffmannii]